jgi:DNA-binding NarL/FixJ family response regulator
MGNTPQPIRMLLADDSDILRRVISNFLEHAPTIEIVGEARNFTELLQKAPELKPHIVLMDLHMRDEGKFRPDFVKSELQASTERVLAMSLFNDGEAIELSKSYGALLLLDKCKLGTDLLPVLEKLSVTLGESTFNSPELIL